MNRIFYLLMMNFSILMAAQDSLKSVTTHFSLKIESLPYAPITGVTIGDNAVVIAIANFKINKTGTSFSYWKSFDFIDDNEGSYDGLFVAQPFKIKKQEMKLKYIHFADFNFERKGISVIGLEAYGKIKNELKWSIQLNNFFYHDRSPRLNLNPIISYKGISLSGWTFYEFDRLTQSFGVGYDSKKIMISSGCEAAFNLIYTTSLSGVLRESDVASLGVLFSFK